MSYEPNEKDWMAYLYGEMEDADKLEFECYIDQHPEARSELERWQNLRAVLSHGEDKEVIAPPPLFGDNEGRRRGVSRSLWNAPYVIRVAAVAAAFLLVLLAGRFTGTKITVSGHEFRLTFGEVPGSHPVKEAEAPPLLSQEQVQEMIDASLNRNNRVVQASLEETQKKLDVSIRQNLAISSDKIDHALKETSAASQEQIRLFVDGIRAENMQQVKDYFQLTSTEQKKYIENLLVDFARYLQQQRSNDLQLVQTRMKSLEQNTDLFKQETEHILSSIITTVGTPALDERKN